MIGQLILRVLCVIFLLSYKSTHKNMKWQMRKTFLQHVCNPVSGRCLTGIIQHNWIILQIQLNYFLAYLSMDDQSFYFFVLLSKVTFISVSTVALAVYWDHEGLPARYDKAWVAWNSFFFFLNNILAKTSFAGVKWLYCVSKLTLVFYYFFHYYYFCCETTVSACL